MRTFQTEAIILRRTNYGEADRILSLITPQNGKLSAIAKGVRKSKSKLAGGLEPFATTNLTIVEGRGEMGLITSARLIHFYGNILHDYERLQLGYELVRLVNKAAEAVTESDFYYLLRDSFAYLDELNIDRGVVELWFRLQFAVLLGHGLNLTAASDSQRLSENAQYDFDFQDMAFIVRPNGKFSAAHIKLLRLASVKTPAILRQVSGLESVIGDCLWLARTLDQ
jgi:DNA repair protein RecO (recombination protein O)